MLRALFVPAIAALDRMNFVAKFFVIGLLLLLPFTYVTHLMLKGSDHQITFNEKESFGVEYIRPAFRLLGHLQDARLAAVARAQDELDVQRRRVDVLLPFLDFVDAKYRDAFRTQDGVDACTTRWRAIQAAWAGLREREFLTPAEAFEAYTPLCKQVTLWILNDVANYSNLILDPDLDSYWLMDAYVGKLPQLTEDISQACARSLLLDRPTLQDRMTISGFHTDARNTLESLIDVNMATAYAQRGALRGRLDDLVQATRARCGEFLGILEARVVVAESPETAELLRSGRVALDVARDLYGRVGPELRSLILARVDGYRRDRRLGLIAAGSATFLYVYLFIAFYLAIHVSVGKVATFTRRMIAGTQERFQLGCRDELATVADAFNEINATLNQTRLLQAELRASEERFRSVADNAPVGIFRTDPAGDGVYANAHCCRLAGLAPSEMQGKGWVKALHPDDRERVVREWAEAVERGVAFTSEYRLGGFWVAGSAVALRDGTGVLTGYLGSVTDITERKRVEKLKNEFISTVSHELRTPLTSIRGSLGLVSNGVTGALPPKAKGMVDIAVKNCDRLVSLVNDILDLEKVASGKMALKMRALEVGTLLEQVVEGTRPYADSLGVKLDLDLVEAAVTVFADAERLVQVVTNLVSNACKFSPRGGTVTVRLRRVEGRVRVEVEDHGPGIPEEFRPRIFQKFAQAATSDDAVRKGTGLGLAISKSLTEAMGGSIGFETWTGKGSVFHVEIPERKLEPAPAGERRQRPRILVCEDEKDIAEVLRTMLDQEGFDADVALSLAEARQLLKRETYAAMTLDLVLPDGHAIPFMRELRLDPATARLPLIVLSAYLDEGDCRLGGHAFGVVDWLEKPIAPDRLSRALGTVLAAGKRPRILHVEDDGDIALVVRKLLQETADVDQAGTVLEAWEKLKVQDYDLLLLDVSLPDGSGLELLPALRKNSSTPIPAVIFSAHELSPRSASLVSAALLKAQTSNQELLGRIRSLLPHPALQPARPGSPTLSS